MTSPAMMLLAGCARPDAAELLPSGRANLAVRRITIAHCLVSMIDGDTSHAEPQAMAGKYTMAHRRGLFIRAHAFADEAAKLLLARNLYQQTQGASA